MSASLIPIKSPSTPSPIAASINFSSMIRSKNCFRLNVVPFTTLVAGSIVETVRFVSTNVFRTLFFTLRLDFEPVQMLPVHHSITKIPLPLFFLDLKPNSQNSEIYNLKRLYHAVIRVEPRKLRWVVNQEYGHPKNYCHKKAKCVKCGEAHLSGGCMKPKYLQYVPIVKVTIQLIIKVAQYTPPYKNPE